MFRFVACDLFEAVDLTGRRVGIETSAPDSGSNAIIANKTSGQGRQVTASPWPPMVCDATHA
jgi:hypothetical protein